MAFRQFIEDSLDAMINLLEIAVGDGADGGVIEVVEPVSYFAAAFDANDWDMGVGGKDEQVEAAADDDSALRCTGLDNGWV